MSCSVIQCVRRSLLFITVPALLLAVFVHRSGAGQLPPQASAIAVAATRPARALGEVPINMSVPDHLVPTLHFMLDRSPTFRRQCAVLGQRRELVIRVREADARTLRRFRARTLVKRHEYGAVVAEVQLIRREDLVELLAHELEHVREQIEGVNLPLLALLEGSGVRLVGGEHFETQRASEVGRRVAWETEHASPTEATY
jgi:hypothetical protein